MSITADEAKALAGELFEQSVFDGCKGADGKAESAVFLKASHTLDNVCSPAFLSRALGIEGVTVAKRKDLVGGVLSDASMVDLAYPAGADKSKPQPARVVIKVPKQADDPRGFAVMGNAYMKELNVYRELSSTLKEIDFNIPECFYTHDDGAEKTEWFVLVIEAMGEGWVVQDQVLGMAAEEWSLASRDLAKLHAKYWGDDTTLNKKWLSEAEGDHSILNFWMPFHPTFPDAYAAFCNIWGSGSSNPRTKNCFLVMDKDAGSYFTSPSDEKAGGVKFDMAPCLQMMQFMAKKENCMPMIDEMNRIIRTRPRTLTYGDFRGDNMFCNTDKTRMCFIDFQLFNAGPPGYDFNQPLGSFGFDVFQGHKNYVSEYFAELKRLNPKAAEEYSTEMFYEDWIIGAIQFVVGIIPLGVATFSQPAEDRMTNLWMYAVNRYGMAIQALGGPEYVKGLAEKLGLNYPGSDAYSFDPAKPIGMRITADNEVTVVDAGGQAAAAGVQVGQVISDVSLTFETGKKILVDNTAKVTEGQVSATQHTHGLGMLIDGSKNVTKVAEGGQAIAQGVAAGMVVTKVGDFSARVSDYSVPASDKDVVAALTAHKSDSKDCGIVFDGESKGSGPFKVATKDAFVAKVMEAKTNGEAANCLESSIKVTFQNKSLI